MAVIDGICRFISNYKLKLHRSTECVIPQCAKSIIFQRFPKY